MTVWPNKWYFIRLRGTKEGQECASMGHLEIFSMSSGERGGRVEELKKSKRSTKGTREVEQEHMRGTTGDRRCTTEVQKMDNPGTTEEQHRGPSPN
mgnify:CR=1 FL=1